MNLPDEAVMAFDRASRKPFLTDLNIVRGLEAAAPIIVKPYLELIEKLERLHFKVQLNPDEGIWLPRCDNDSQIWPCSTIELINQALEEL